MYGGGGHSVEAVEAGVGGLVIGIKGLKGGREIGNGGYGSGERRRNTVVPGLTFSLHVEEGI